jgi:hypothetical protein
VIDVQKSMVTLMPGCIDQLGNRTHCIYPFFKLFNGDILARNDPGMIDLRNAIV